MMNQTGSDTDNNPDNDQAENTDFGRLLAEARKAGNYTVDEVSGHLKIPARTIVALEANDTEKLPASTFTQGYIRAYAKFLGIQEHDVLAVYNRAVPHDYTSDLKPRSNLPDEASSQSPLIKAISIFMIIAVIAVIVFGGIRYYQKKADVLDDEFDTRSERFSGDSLDSPRAQRLSIKLGARLTTDDGPVAEKQGSLGAAVETVSKAGSDDRDTGASTETMPETAKPVKADAEVAQSKAGSAVDSDNDSIEIFAENGSWVEVRDANKSRLLYNMLPAGGSRKLVGRAPFSVIMGNARTTRVLVNGIEVDVSDYIRSNNTANFKVSIQGQDVIFH